MNLHIWLSFPLAVVFVFSGMPQAERVQADWVAIRQDGSPAEGIYAVATGDDGVEDSMVVKLNSGRELRLGRKLTDKLGTAEVWSRANDNQMFSLNLKGVADLPANVGHMVIVAAGQYLFVNSHGSQEDGLTTLHARIAGKKAADQVAKAFNTKVHLRQHPGHKIITRFTPKAESFPVGQPVEIQLEIKNVGDGPIRFYQGGQQRGYRDNQFRFTAMSGSGYGPAVPDTGNPRNFGGMAGLQTIQPGESFKIDIGLDKWFQLEAPDTYLITGLYEIELYSEDDRRHALWHDFAVGECHVVVVERAAAR
ncbi:MAG: hypothetical protein MPJ50_14640 [Pirellulales bacterium]|nr:hypothetical protein [Pirellulales bacterium]